MNGLLTQKLSDSEYIASATKYYIVNHIAGKGINKDAALLSGGVDFVYETKSVGDCRRYVADVCRKDPGAWIIVYGGDGTISEAVSGIMDADAGETAAFSAVGTGSGNDFVRYMNVAAAPDVIHELDVVRANDKYSVNMINIGFDCDVVVETEKMRKSPLAGGSFGYILGVVRALAKKKTFNASIELQGVNGTDENETVNGEVLLTAIAECPYCGGGFNAVPVARPDDGLVDLLIVKNITRTRFIQLVGYYRAGTHFLSDGTIDEKFKDILVHKRCKSFELSGLARMCVDGEVSETDNLKAEVIGKALRYIVPSKEMVDAAK